MKNNQNKTCRNGQAHDKIEEWVGVFGTSRDVLLQVIREIWDDWIVFSPVWLHYLMWSNSPCLSSLAEAMTIFTTAARITKFTCKYPTCNVIFCFDFFYKAEMLWIHQAQSQRKTHFIICWLGVCGFCCCLFFAVVIVQFVLLCVFVLFTPINVFSLWIMLRYFKIITVPACGKFDVLNTWAVHDFSCC